MDESALRTLWCGNLSSEVVDELLFELFLQAGPLEKVSLPKDRDGRSKGYGFITFKHECSVPYAMDLMKGVALFGRTVNLQNRTGAKDNTVYDSRNSYQQRNVPDVNQGRPYPGPLPNIDFHQSLSPLLSSLSGFLSGNPLMQGLMPQIPLDMMLPPPPQDHQRSRSLHSGDRYGGNSRDDRREYYGNRDDRQRSRGNDHCARPGDGNYYGRSRGNSYHDRNRDRDRTRDRDRDRNRSNHRSHDDRYRSRE